MENPPARRLWHRPCSRSFLYLRAYALQFVAFSYVAPAREISILIGAAMGAGLLAEGDVPRRPAAASVMIVGLVALAVG